MLIPLQVEPEPLLPVREVVGWEGFGICSSFDIIERQRLYRSCKRASFRASDKLLYQFIF